MTEERKQLLKLNRPPVIKGFILINGFIDINGAILEYKDANGGIIQHRINSLTNGGYYSKKSIYVDWINQNRIEYPVANRPIIILTQDECNYLLELFPKADGKIFRTEKQKAQADKMWGLIALAQKIDIHDRG